MSAFSLQKRKNVFLSIEYAYYKIPSLVISLNECIRLINVSKQFHKIIAVNAISFDVPKGSLCAFLGSNGAGKSTTMNMMITLLTKTSGKIYIDGLDMDNERNRIRQKIGVVFQEDILDGELTVYENLYYRGGLYLPNCRALKKRILEISQLLQIDQILKKTYKTCSGGQKRLVQIGRAILPQPQLLILDEPTIGLDPLAREHVWSIIKKLNSELHMTVFYSTHYMEEACLANEICMIHNGELLTCKTMSEQYRKTSKENTSSQLQQLYLSLLRSYESKAVE